MDGGVTDDLATAVMLNEPVWLPEHGQMKRLYQESREGTSEGSKRARTCFDFFHDRQWTAKETKVLRDRKQPVVWENLIKPAVNGVLGVLEQGQADPRALPRNNGDLDSAEVATDGLRYAADRSRWQRRKLASARDYLVGGIAACIVEVNDDGDPDPRPIRWGEFFADPHSRDDDYRDARYMGIAKWMYADQVKTRFGLQGEIDYAAFMGRSLEYDEDDADKPAAVSWGDAARKRVLVVEMYIDDGGWKRCVFYGGGLLEYAESAYVDEQGRPANPIVAQSCEVDQDNQRMGIVWSFIPMQQEVNMRRSKLLHTLNSRQVRQIERDVDVSMESVRQEAARPDGAIPFGWDTIPMSDVTAGNAQLLNDTRAVIDRLGPNPAVLGRQNADASGRAQLVRQQAGLIELTPALGGIEDFELRVYQQMWCRIRQFWTEPKWIRVTDDVGAPKFLQVNEPEVDEFGEPAMDMVMAPATGQPMMQPRVKNRPADMDMDIIIDATPDTANLQQEQFAEIMKLVPIYGPQAFPLKVVIKASSLPKKRELLDELDAMQQQAQQGQQPDPRQEAAFAADMENKAADTEVKRSTALKNTVAARSEGLNALMQATGPMEPPPLEQQPLGY